MSEKRALIDEFAAVTGADSAHATSFLDAYNWDFDAAVDGYFDSDDKPPPVDNRCDSDFEMHHNDLPPRDPRDPSNNCDKKFKSYSREGCSSNIATLASLSASDRQHSSSSNSDDEEGQAFYAGGSVHSGQQVLGPSKKAEGGFGIVKQMVKSAVRHGAKVVNASEANREAAQVLAFKGVGHVLGSTTNDSVAVSDIDESLVHGQPLEVCLKAWKNGFTIDDGPLRDYNDPENKAFLDDVRNGEVPQELTRRMLNSQRPRNYEGDIHISLEDHSHEDYQPPKQTLQAFTGTGYRLGSPTPVLTVPTSSSDNAANENEARGLLKVDESQPVTVVQVRLSDGSRLKIMLNDSHTVNDIRQYIVLARPEYGSSVFTLMNSNSFPLKEITDDSLSIKEANLFNSVLVLRIK